MQWVVLLILVHFTQASAHHSLTNLDLRDFIGFIFLFIAIVFGNAAGVGGGGIIMPTLIILFNFEILQASALSNSMICIGFIIKFCFNVCEKHPKFNKPLINYDSGALMLPCALIGVKLGLFIHDIMPQPLLFIILTVTLTVISYKTYTQGLKISSNENKSAKATPKAAPLIQLKEIRSDEMQPGPKDDLWIEIRKEDEKQIPLDRFAMLILSEALLIISMIVEGSKGSPSILGLTKCSSGYWTSYILFIIGCIIVTGIVARSVQGKYLRKILANYPIQDGDIEWTMKKTIEYGLFGVLAGILSAIFGIGGGMVLTPLLSQLGMIPEVVASTGGLFVLFTTLGSTLMLITHGYWNISYGIFTAVISVIASVLSIYAVKEYLKKTGKTSIIIFVLAGIIFISGFLIAGFGFYEEYEQYHSLFARDLWKLKDYCSS